MDGIVDPAYVVIRISEMMKNWKELSMHVDTEGGDVTAKFYMNIKEIQKVASLPELSEREYRCYGCSFRLDMIRHRSMRKTIRLNS